MKKKFIIYIGVVVFIISVVITVRQNAEFQNAIKPVEIANIPLDYQLKGTQFYYSQLTEEEKEIYIEVKKLLDQHRGGEIILKRPINAKSYYHIESPFRYDYENYWYLAYLYPFDKNNRLVIVSNEQYSEDRRIEKMLLLIDLNWFQREIQPLSKEDVIEAKNELESEDDVLRMYQKHKTYLDTWIDDDLNYYDKVDDETERILQHIIEEMPGGLNQETAVQYFSQWLVDNMSYSSKVANYIMTGDLLGYDYREEIAAGSIVGIRNKSGTCTGFSLILMTLCNRVGIDANIILGYAFDGRHGWVEVNIGGETYYKDPTSEISNKKLYHLLRRSSSMITYIKPTNLLQIYLITDRKLMAIFPSSRTS